MPTDRVSLADVQGLPLEERCMDTLLLLRDVSRFIEDLSVQVVIHRQAKTKVAIPFEVQELVHKTMWENAVAFARAVYGDEATDFALKTIAATRTLN